MRKEIKTFLAIDGQKICRITTIDERWYEKETLNPITGLPESRFYPSSTWICHYYYTSPFLIKWIAEKGYDEAEAIKKEAGAKGDRTHKATEEIDKGKEIAIDAKFLNKETQEMEELTAEEYANLIAYRNWLDEIKPQPLANEMTVFAELYAGTLDRIYRIKGQIWLVDIKTSRIIGESYKLQISSYSHCDIDYKKLGITDGEWKNRKLAILQLGASLNKNGWRWTEIEDKYDVFINVAYGAWKNENPDIKPFQRDYPLIIQSQWIKEYLSQINTPKIKAIKKVQKAIKNQQK